MENNFKLRIKFRIPDIVVHRPMSIKLVSGFQTPVMVVHLQEQQSSQLIRYLTSTQTNKRVAQRHSDR
jgi:hypothetical protein